MDGIALAAPAADAFVAVPASWYLACHRSSIRSGRIASCTIAGKRIAVFRDRAGRLAALDARCAHLGADLTRGRLVNGHLECPYHHRRFDADGRCGRLTQPGLPVEERYGHVFVFLGARPAFPFPGFDGQHDSRLVSARAFTLVLDTEWFMVAANAFDVAHFSTSHARELLGAPVRARCGEHDIGIGYRFRVAGSSVVDRVTRWLSGAEVEFRIRVWGGNLVLVETRFERDRSFGLVVAEPLRHARGGTTRVRVVVSAQSCAGPARGLRNRVRLALKRLAVRAMMNKDVAGLGSVHYHGHGLQPGDEVLAGFLAWAARRPGITATRRQEW